MEGVDRRMRVLTGIVVALALAWSAYWVLGARAADRAARALIDTRAQAGQIATYDDLSVRGFPSRFDITLTAPRFGDPARGLVWQAPFVQILSLSYKPWHLILALPPDQQIDAWGQQLSLRSEKLQASVVVRPTGGQPLDRLTMVGTGLTLLSAGGWQAAADSLRLASRSTGDTTHQVAIDMTALAPDPALVAATGLPATLTTAHAEATLALSAPLALGSADRPVRVDGLTLDTANLRWGSVTLTASGSLRSDPMGRAEGRIDLVIRDWRPLLPLLSQAIPGSTPTTLDSLMTGLAGATGTPDSLSLPLTFAEGQMRLGPLPLGPAPALR